MSDEFSSERPHHMLQMAAGELMALILDTIYKLPHLINEVLISLHQLRLFHHQSLPLLLRDIPQSLDGI